MGIARGADLEAMMSEACDLEAHHLCTRTRGVRELAPLTRTVLWRGVYAGDPALRGEFLAMRGVQQ
ncbi:MAG TPA: hypothetical protein VIJ28_10760 [Chloroflexota bacterium]|jgi:GTP cyclohydrolase I